MPTKITNYIFFAFVISLFSFFVFLTANAQEAETNTETTPPVERREVLERAIEVRQANQEQRQEERASSSEARQENRAEAMEERQEQQAERVEARQVLQAERQVELDKLRQQRILNLSANISNRMEAAIGRLFDIVGRLEERISKLKKNGIDTESAEAKLREAAQILSTARANLANIDKQVNDATTSTEPISRWEQVRTTYQETGKLIRASHQALRETLSLLKTAIIESRPPQNNSNTVTPEETATSTEEEN